ncbi:hypothetical protein RJ640_008949 [Escallonia rubra]|uniref:Uncharacterized protein n=1 Tax=Escallonia rubra TaxID=112253 RepID=A0AA88UMQ1_9ASTE|nr:hypothetical protein RJ640_008949 [Escallonia rubra]
MNEHLRVMSNMIGKLRDAGHALTDEQQVRAVIRSLPTSWANMKQILTHSENIKNFHSMSSLRLRLEMLIRPLLMSPKGDRAMQMASAEDKIRKARKQGHFARDCTEPKKVPSEYLSQLYVSSHVTVVDFQCVWFVDTGATKHVARDREGLQIITGFQWEANISSYEMIALRSIGDTGKNLDLYELEEVEVTLPSPSEVEN